MEKNIAEREGRGLSEEETRREGEEMVRNEIECEGLI